MKKMNVVLAMSGGIDSSISAYLLKQQGHKVIGVFMRNWEEQSMHCQSESNWKDVQSTCNSLDIPCYRLNFAKEYWLNVFQPFLQSYADGLTPNPDIYCNSMIKFGCLHDEIFKRQWKEFDGNHADRLATGHYVRTDGAGRLFRGIDKWKDQSYFLSHTKSSRLRNCLFPVGNLEKRHVKLLGSQLDWTAVLKKKESMGICFVGNAEGPRQFQQFLSDYINDQPGIICDIESGSVVGEHKGIHQFTIGQRIRSSTAAKRLYVVSKCLERNTIFVTASLDHPLLNPKTIHLQDINWICDEPKYEMVKHVKIRHNSNLVSAHLRESGKLSLNESVFAAAPGQSVALYGDDDECLGGGTVTLAKG